MSRWFAVALWSMVGCSSGPSGAPDDAGHDTGPADVGVDCVCPCGPVVAPPGTHCWQYSCDPHCGPGSGNAC